MLRSEAVGIIKRGLGFRQTQDSAIVAALQQVQRDLEHGKTLPSWLVVFDATIAVAADAVTVSLPTGFLRFHEDYPPWFLDSNGAIVYLPRRHADEAAAAYGSDLDGVARVFVQRNATTIELVPPFTAAQTMYLTYYKAADVLNTDVENAWLANAANYLIGLAGVQVAGDLQDKGAMEKFALMAKMGNAAYMNGVVDEELAGRPLVMGRNN